LLRDERRMESGLVEKTCGRGDGGVGALCSELIEFSSKSTSPRNAKDETGQRRDLSRVGDVRILVQAPQVLVDDLGSCQRLRVTGCGEPPRIRPCVSADHDAREVVTEMRRHVIIAAYSTVDVDLERRATGGQVVHLRMQEWRHGSVVRRAEVKDAYTSVDVERIDAR